MARSSYPVKVQKYPIKCTAPFERLPELAYNLWWSWNDEAQALFHEMDAEHWRKHRNPVKLLKERGDKLLRLAQDVNFIKRYRDVMQHLDESTEVRNHWFAETHPQHRQATVTYFSPEFGLHECLPVYSGGLGVLAGDHIKTASDLGIPMIGVGLLYKNGYFTQQIDATGRQVAIYPNLSFNDLPIVPVDDHRGSRLLVSVSLPNRKVYAQCWRVAVGAVQVLLLDTDVPQNNRKDRAITGQLYGGDREMRISQEIVLGMGGVRALAALGIEPAVWHMNEGHVAFLCFERMRRFMTEGGMDFAKAIEAVAANTVFTTHTPVPAGNEAFDLPLMHKYFKEFCEELSLDIPALINLGLQTDQKGLKFFSMTVLSLRLSNVSNGVSQLHGEVSRSMWKSLWPSVPERELPITAITNGVHAHTWMAPAIGELYDRFVGDDWRERLDDAGLWEKAHDIPDEILWRVHQERKAALIEVVREKLCEQYRRNGASKRVIQAASKALDPAALTIGFARRFATYKRADLLFSDLKRLEKIVNSSKRPVQIIFAGKAHPRDAAGQAILQRVYRMTQRPNLRGKVVLLEGYDINLGQHLVQGVDVWLNNPRRPQEASGTSGQKVPLNGGINLSVLDGWWAEGYNGRNGWKIGKVVDYRSEVAQDSEDAADLYRLLEREVIPLYYQRDQHAMPKRWIKKMKESMASLIPKFTTTTMVKHYVEQLYLPTLNRGLKLSSDDFASVKEIVLVKEQFVRNWPLVYVTEAQLSPSRNGKLDRAHLNLEAKIYLAGLRPDMVNVEVLHEGNSGLNGKMNGKPTSMTLVKAQDNGICHYRKEMQNNGGKLMIRVFPRHEALGHKHALGLMHWREIA